MLVVTRKVGESIMIGDDVEISIVKLGDGSVKIGVEAPKDIKVLRKEIFEAVKSENKLAANINLDILKSIKSSENGED